MTPRHLTDIELADPIRTHTGLAGYAALQALVRLHGEPLGEITVPIVNGAVTAPAITQKIREELWEPLLKACLRNRLQGAMAGDRGFALSSLLSPPAAPPSHPLKHDHSPPEGAALPLVTVAVCTKDRPSDVRRCLDALQKLEYPRLEYLVVDNAPSDDETQRLVQSAYPDVRYVQEPRPGLNWARNRAVLEARGAIIAYADDDVVVDPAWATAFVRIFTAASDVACVTGLVLPAELDTEAQCLFETYGGFGRGYDREWYTRAGHQAFTSSVFHHGPGRFGTGANMAFRRSVFADIGGFDPALDVGTATTGGGDLEMYFRILQEGYSLVYEPRALLRHRHRRSMDGLHRQIETWGRSLFAFKARALAHYPEERAGFREMTTWWRRYTGRRLLKSLWGSSEIPASLIWAEVKTVWDGAASYRRACADVRRVEAAYGPQPSLCLGDSLPHDRVALTEQTVPPQPSQAPQATDAPPP